MSCLNCGRNDSHDSDCFYDDSADYEFSLDQKFEYYNTSPAYEDIKELKQEFLYSPNKHTIPF